MRILDFIKNELEFFKKDPEILLVFVGIPTGCFVIFEVIPSILAYCRM